MTGVCTTSRSRWVTIRAPKKTGTGSESSRCLSPLFLGALRDESWPTNQGTGRLTGRTETGVRARRGSDAADVLRRDEAPTAVLVELEEFVVEREEVVVLADAQVGDRRLGQDAIERPDLVRAEALGHLVEEDEPGTDQQDPRQGDQVLLALGVGAAPVVLGVEPADPRDGLLQADPVEDVAELVVAEGAVGGNDLKPLAERAADGVGVPGDELDGAGMRAGDPPLAVLPEAGDRQEERLPGGPVRAPDEQVPPGRQRERQVAHQHPALRRRPERETLAGHAVVVVGHRDRRRGE